MGDALVIFKIYPEGIDEIEQVEKGVKAITEGDVKEVRREPIAFGLELIKAGIAIPDKEEGRMQKLEDAVRAIPGVKEVEVEGITLI